MLTYIMGIPWFFGYFNQLGEGWQWAFISLNLSTGIIIFYESLPVQWAMSGTKEDVDETYPSIPVIGMRENSSDEEDIESPSPFTYSPIKLPPSSSIETTPKKIITTLTLTSSRKDFKRSSPLSLDIGSGEDATDC